MEKDWLVFIAGVVPAVSSDIGELTMVGENVPVQTLVYNIFFNSIRNNGRNIIENRLFYDGAGHQTDWEDLEKKLSNPQTTLMILCSPHNPTGMIWMREELGRAGKLYAANHVKTMSDEIHCDLTEPGYDYIPFTSILEIRAQNSIICIASTEALNLAGLQTAAVTALDRELYHKMERALNTDEVAEPNTFATETAIAVPTKGEDWPGTLRMYLAENRKTARKFPSNEILGMPLVPVHAACLLWLDYCRIIVDASELYRYLRREIGPYLLADMAHGGNGREFLRMNIVCPKEWLPGGLECLKQGVKTYEEYVIGSCR